MSPPPPAAPEMAVKGEDTLTQIGWSPSPDDIAEFVRATYGMVVHVTKLTSERDDNYLVISQDGTHRLLKLAHAAEDPAVFDLQLKAFQHIAMTAPHVPVQRLVATLTGSLEAHFVDPAGTRRQARMLSYFEGVPLSGCPPSRRLAVDLGRLAAQLDIALRDFAHPGSSRRLLWDMQQAVHTRPMLAYTQNVADRLLCEAVIDRFERHLAPTLRDLRAQIIHNDLNPHNVIVDPKDLERLTGIIDFGDMVYAPLVDEIAVASAYLLNTGSAALGNMLDFVSAYHAENPLLPEEITLLPGLIAVRQAMTIVISNWRAGLHPENRDYILRNQPMALEGLRKLTMLDERQVCSALLDACDGSAT